MALASKMFKLKEWLTVPDTARHLSIMFGEEVNEPDVLLLALNGHLRLSVSLVKGTIARTGRVVLNEELVWKKLDLTMVSSEGLAAFCKIGLPEDHIVLNTEAFDALPGKIVHLGRTQVIKLDENVSVIGGLWDVPMLGLTKRYVEDAYQHLTGVPSPAEEHLFGLEGIYLVRPNGEACELQDSFEEDLETREAEKTLDPYYPAESLPEDCVLLVRTSALTDLIERLEKENEKATVHGAQKESCVRPREKEKPLFTLKDIANHCGVHIDTVKDWRNNYKDFPASPPGQGRVTALPSELNAWLVGRKKK